jgi:Mg2+-importing ATPase
MAHVNAPEEKAYWSFPREQLLIAMGSGPQGLTTEQAAAVLEEHGPNLLQGRHRTLAFQLLLGQFKNAIVLILLAATLISAVTGDWLDALIILAIIMGSVLLSFFQEYRASDAVEQLRARVQAKARVVRDGQPLELPAADVVPGDVVLLSAGSLIPADGVLLEARDLYVNQAVLTGETFPVEKQTAPTPAAAELVERTNCVYMGTNVRSGTGRALITATGRQTVFGGIADRLTMRPPETEFERGVRHFGYLLTQVMMVLVFIVFAVNVLFHKPALDALLFSVALAVGLTPQLLPAIITITLAKGSQVMAREGVIVRRLASIENFGSMDVLCTDKTGTLTEGVVRLDAALDWEGQPSADVMRFAYLNAHLQTGLVNPLDEAIQAQPAFDIGQVIKLDEVPYDFVRRRMSVAVQDGDQRLLIAKGALDGVLAACRRVWASGPHADLDDSVRQAIEARFAAWSAQGYRVLGVATKQMAAAPPYGRDDEHDMDFQGFLLFLDPPKAGVREAISSLSALGVQLKIISGDNRLVARHLAETIGLAVPRVVTGADLDNLRDEALWHVVEECNLFAEVDPNQKERIILALQKMHHVVGYMGDGINDAPALHAADVGISVDKAVDVAKEAADLVLLQQDLDVLRRGIEQGRRTFANTLKYIFITTSANFGNMFSMAGASLFLKFLPMLPKQILLTNFMTDFPAISIAGDTVDSELVQAPRRWNIAFVRNFMFVFGLVSSLFDYMTFGTLLWVLKANEAQFQTGWYLESTLTELVILLIVRTQRPFYRSKPVRALLMAVLGVAAITVFLPYSPLSKMLGFTPLPLALVGVLVLITALYMAASEWAKRIFYRHVHF